MCLKHWGLNFLTFDVWVQAFLEKMCQRILRKSMYWMWASCTASCCSPSLRLVDLVGLFVMSSDTSDNGVWRPSVFFCSPGSRSWCKHCDTLKYVSDYVSSCCFRTLLICYSQSSAKKFSAQRDAYTQRDFWQEVIESPGSTEHTCHSYGSVSRWQNWRTNWWTLSTF